MRPSGAWVDLHAAARRLGGLAQTVRRKHVVKGARPEEADEIVAAGLARRDLDPAREVPGNGVLVHVAAAGQDRLGQRPQGGEVDAGQVAAEGRVAGEAEASRLFVGELQDLLAQAVQVGDGAETCGLQGRAARSIGLVLDPALDGPERNLYPIHADGLGGLGGGQPIAAGPHAELDAGGPEEFGQIAKAPPLLPVRGRQGSLSGERERLARAQEGKALADRRRPALFLQAGPRQVLLAVQGFGEILQVDAEQA